MHTGLEEHARDFDKLAAFFAERARGGVGLIVTGGIAPNIEGWLKPFARTAFDAVAGRAASQDHARRARGRRPHLHADPARGPLRVSPAVGRAVGDQVADHAVQAARADARAASSARSGDFVALRGARAGRRLRRRRDHGLGRLSASTSSCAERTNRAHDDWGGSSREPHALPGRNRAPHARSGRARIHHHLSAVDARSGRRRQHLGRGRRARARQSKRPARRSSTPASAGTRRASRRS